MKARDRHAGTNWGDITAQARQISSWIQNANWQNTGDIDRVISRLMSNPDKWIDPNLTASVNYARVKRDFGLMTQGDRKKQLRDARGQERDRARRALWENYEAIEAGEKSQLVDDIEAEYGADFVAEALARAREDAAGVERDRERGAPEPNDANLSTVAEANGPAGAEPAAPEVSAEPEPASAPGPDAGLPTPGRTPADSGELDDASTAPSPTARDYSGLAGFVRLVVDAVRGEYRAGAAEARPTDDPQTTLSTYQ